MITGSFASLEPVQHFQPAATWQHPVQQHDIRTLIHHQRIGIVDIVCLDTTKVSYFQSHAQHIPDRGLVVHHKHRRFIHCSFSHLAVKWPY